MSFPVPWGAYIAGHANNTSALLYDYTGKGRDATIGGSGLSTSTASGRGAAAAIPMITGTPETTIVWPVGSIPANFTICSITRYESGTNRRILDGTHTTSVDWLHGHWDNNAGWGLYNGSGWISRATGVTLTDWHVICGTNNTLIDVSNNFTVDGIAKGLNKANYTTGTVNVGVVSGGFQMTINKGYYYLSGTTSNFSFSQLLIWDTPLTQTQMASVSSGLMNYLSTGNNTRLTDLWTPAQLVAVGLKVSGTYFPIISWSVDGINWYDSNNGTAISPASGNYATCIAYGNGIWVAGFNKPTKRIAFSTDGKTWVNSSNADTKVGAGQISGIYYGNSMFVAVPLSGYIGYSTDGNVWNSSNYSIVGTGWSVHYWPKMSIWVAGGLPIISGGKEIIYSLDGMTWTPMVSNAGVVNSQCFAFTSNSQYVVAVGVNKIAYSSDGMTWTGVSVASPSGWRAVTWDGSRFIAVSANSGTNVIATSATGTSWSFASGTFTNASDGIGLFGNIYVISAQNSTNTIQYTANANLNASNWINTNAKDFFTGGGGATALAMIVPTPPNKPTILYANILNSGNTSVVFNQSAANPPVSGYYYSVNGTSYVSTTATASTITIPGKIINQPITLISYNTVGNSGVSSSVTIGTTPIINSITQLNLGLNVYFAPSTGATATNYFYSIDGGNTFGNSTTSIISPLQIANLSTGISYSVSIYASGTNWVSANSDVYTSPTVISIPYSIGNAAGGTYNQFTYNYVGYSFTNTSGNGNIQFPVDTVANVLVVAGGGGGGCGINSQTDFAAGGGGGGVGIGTITFKAGVIYNITVGSGGAGGRFLGGSSFSNSFNGGNSSIVGVNVSEIAYGGGYGACVGQIGGSGGSGGGAHSGGTGYATSGSATKGTGNRLTYFGSAGTVSVASTTYGGGGGGGAGGVGGALVQYGGARGGNGIAWGINGTVYGGGGGGSAAGTGYLSLGYGGTGGGGNGGGWLSSSIATLATSGTPNTGGGGGGTPTGFYSQSYSVGNINAGNGGSGIVMIAFSAPLSVGTVAPNITSIVSGINSITVNYTGSVGANPLPYYYYSVSGNTFANSGYNTNTSIVISGLTSSSVYTVQLMAVNSVGNVLSGNATGIPNLLGTRPNIISVANLANALSVSFQGVLNWNPQPTYYYSISGNVPANYLQANVSGNTFIISNLKTFANYTVYLLANNVVGNVYSATLGNGSPLVLGNLNGPYNVNNSSLTLYFPFNADFSDYSTGAAVVPTKDAGVSFVAGTGNALVGGLGSAYFGPTNSAGITTKNISTLGQNGITVGLWLKATLTGYTRFFMFTGTSANPYFTMYALAGGILGVSFSGGNTFNTNYTISDSNWHHYCIVISAAGNFDIYVDGINRGSRAINTPSFLSDYANFNNLINTTYNIGGNDGFGVPLRNSYMTQFIMLKRAITMKELSIIVNNPTNLTITSFVTSELGPYPNIIAVYSNISSLTVRYSGATNANPPPFYYYSVDGQAFANSGINASSGNINIPNITAPRTYTVQLMAVNPAGNVVSNQANGAPFLIGAKPDILSVASTANSITVSFQPSNGDPPPIYYYSLNGNVATSFANAFSNANASINLSTNTLVIGNLFTTTIYSVFLLAQNTAGNTYSTNAVSAQSATLGTAPNIRNIYGNLNSLIVQFNATVGGYPTPYYYYSVNGQVAANSGLTTNIGNIVISNLTVAGNYTVQLIAVNAAGNLGSNQANGQPYIVGSWPNINSVASLANALSVSFQTSVGGYPTPAYTFSLDGGNTYSNANITNLTATSATIGNLFNTRSYSVSVGAINAAGNVYSVSPVEGQPYTLGTIPSITNIYSNLNSLIVEFAASTGGYTTPYYYYSVNGQAAANSGLTSNASNLLIQNLTVANVYSVQVIAVNPAGNLGSNKANGQPYILGSNPNINSVASLANALSVSFQSSVGGYPTPPDYYYSLDGGSTYSNANVLSQTANTLVIGNLYTATVYSVGLVAINTAGNAYSANIVSQQPYVLGTAVPNITAVYSGLNSLSVQFSGSAGAYPAPYYYYSVNGGVFSNAGTTSSDANIVISGFTQANTYSIRVMAVNYAGNLVSNSVDGQPFIFGTKPNIISVTSGANTLSVSFQASVGGYDTPVYYYSLNGNVAGSFSAAGVSGNASSFIIEGLTANVEANVYLLAINAAGNVYSATSFQQTPYVLGNTEPTIQEVYSNINSLSIQFAAAQNANPAPFYYYSVDGSIFSNSGLNSNASWLTIPNITVLGNHSVQLMAVNPAGNVASNTAEGQPYLLGSNPNIISVEPLANALSVSFQTSVGGYDTPVYYYSVVGNVAGAFVSAGANGNASSFIIGGLTANVTATVAVLAKNAAGNVYSTITVQQTPYVVGNAGPTIQEVYSNINSLSVQFASALNANPAPFYYYSVDGSIFSNSGLNSNASWLTIPNITVLGNHSVQLMAVNPAGNVVSNTVEGQPYLLGSKPNIISLTPLANALSVSFQSSVGGYDTPVYYYSVVGNVAGAFSNAGASGNASSFIIGGLTENVEANVVVLAINAAGNVYSETTATQTPYVLGNTSPFIFYVASGLNSLSVSFAAALNANPTPYYYYSVDGQAFANAGVQSNTGLITIANVFALGDHSVRLMAVNAAGNVISNSVIGRSLLLGSSPNIVSVSPLANALSVSFQASVGGYPDPTYYYSLNGNSATDYFSANIVGNANSFIVDGLTVNVSSTISLLAQNSAGNVYSATTVQQTPYVLGNAGPEILQINSEVNSLSVQFAAAQNANPEPFYYYSVNGGVFSNSGLNSNASSIVVPNLFVAGNYSVRIMAVNAAGNVLSSLGNGQPYVVGTQPNIISVANLANSLAVSFQGVSGWYPDPAYYYSVNGNTSSSYVAANVEANGFIIPNLFVANTYYVDLVAINVAGNVYSSTIKTGNPYVLGTAVPNIREVSSAVNSLILTFDGTSLSLGAFPEPFYYYSVNGSIFSNSGLNSNTSNLVVPNLTVAGNYTVSIMSVSPAGNLVSTSAYGQPYVVGTQPNIISVANLANSLAVSFQGVSGWYPDPAYYYSVNGNTSSSYVAANVVANSFIVSNLFVANTYYVDLVAINVAGNVYSGIIKTGNPYVLGTVVPNIRAVSSAVNSLIITFDGAVGAFPEPFYYYSVDGSIFSNSGLNSNTSNLIVPNLTVAGNYSVSIMSVSPAGNLVSGLSYGQPYVVGTKPNIVSVSSLANALSVSFQSSVAGYPAPEYYYSLDGGNTYFDSGIGPNANVLVIGNLTTATVYNVSMLAFNAAGNAYSATSVPGEPYVVGSTGPFISNIASNLNSLVVSFSASIGAYPEPFYYYSVDGGAYANAGVNSNTSVIVVPNLSVAKSYTIRLLASNPAGNVESNAVSGEPYVVGTKPNIVSVSSLANAISVSFQSSVAGYPEPTYYYSLDGGNTYLDSGLGPNANVLVIGNLTTATVYNVSMLAINAAGNAYSAASVPGEPYVVGSTGPFISNIASNLNSLVVSFSASIGAYPEPFYYYSVDGGAYANAGINSNTSAMVVPNLSVAKSYAVKVMASNPAGNVVSNTVSGEPYVVGTAPTIIDVVSVRDGLIIDFSGSTLGYPAPETYYYTLDAGNTFVDSRGTTSPILVGNLATGTYSVGVIASSIAGNTGLSNIVLGAPYIVGAAPIITSVDSAIDSLIVNFTSPAGAVPPPYAYYYSLNGGQYINTGSTALSVTIGNLSISGTYGVNVLAVSLVGNTAPSITVYQKPYVIGLPPVVTVSSALHTLIINWTDISGGYPAAYTYLYSLDGVNYVNTNSNVGPVVVSGLTTPVARPVSVKAMNTIGITAPSNTVLATPYVIGSAPVIQSLNTTVNGFTVDFTGPLGGYPPPSTYLYSLDGGSNYIDSETDSAPLTILNLSPLQSYAICLKAVNAGGITGNSNIISGTPFIVVEAPAITNVVRAGNNLEVFFNPSPGTYNNPFVYLYSVNGSNFVGAECTEPPLIITNYTSGTGTRDLVQSGNTEIIIKAVLEVAAYSAPIPPQNPHVIGSAPIITGVSSTLNGISVDFLGPVGGNPAPTTYYYSLNDADYVDSRANSSPIGIGNLTALSNYSVSIVANNLGGNTIPSNTAYGRPYVIGSAPVLLDVSGIDNGLQVSFTESTGGYPTPTTYYYSVNGVDYLDSYYSASPLTIYNLSPVEIYTVSVKALNAGGLSAASNSLLGTPYSITTSAVITNATLNNGQLVITFNPIQTSVLYPTPIVYYYSFNGSNEFKGARYTSSPIIVNGVLERVESIQIKGLIEITSFSVPYTGQPYVIGTPPTISVQSIETGLVIDFTPGINGYPEVFNYYYSLNNGNTFVDANTTVSPITILGFTEAIECSVVLIGRNLGGNTAPSNMVVRTPYISGSIPVVTSVESDVNSLIVSFLPSTGGSPVPSSYYYSIDGVNYIDSGSTESPLIIPNLNVPGVSYPVSIKAFNTMVLGPASNVVFGKPHVAGYAPLITGIQSEFQQMSVSFVNNGAYPVPTQYYYSLDGGVSFAPVGQTASPFLISGLTTNTGYRVFMLSVNVAGPSPLSEGFSVWTQSTAAFFRNTMNPTYSPYTPIYLGNLPDNTRVNTGANDSGLSTKQKYAQYVSGTGRTRR